MPGNHPVTIKTKIAFYLFFLIVILGKGDSYIFHAPIAETIRKKAIKI